MDIEATRTRLMSLGLSESEVPADPMPLFDAWLELARSAGIHNANAMAIASAGPTGRPSVRNVLVQEVLPDGLAFYTNYRSRKGVELDGDPRCEGLFSWLDLERQVRSAGRVRRSTAAESDAYFAGRPRGNEGR